MNSLRITAPTKLNQFGVVAWAGQYPISHDTISDTEILRDHMAEGNQLNGLYRQHQQPSTAQDLPALTLYENGLIRDCNAAGAKLLGCASSYLIWQHISTFLPQLGDVSLVNGERVNPYLCFLTRVGHQFEVVSTTGAHFFSAVFFNDVEDFGRHCLRIIFRPIAAPTF